MRQTVYAALAAMMFLAVPTATSVSAAGLELELGNQVDDELWNKKKKKKKKSRIRDHYGFGGRFHTSK